MTARADQRTLDLPAEFDQGDCTDFGACIVTLDQTIRATSLSATMSRSHLKGSAVVVGDGFVAYQLFYPHIDQDQTTAIESR